MGVEHREQRLFLLGSGLLLVALLVLLAAWPFLTRPGLPRDTDAELHVFRAAEVAACWQAGVLYPRWAPDFYYGYGYPIFNYYAPLTYHLSALLALLPGMDIVAGVKGVFVLGLFLGGVGAWLLARDLFGAEAGVLAAALFLFSPYVMFINPHGRGDLAEHFAVNLLPLALFFLRRQVEWGGRLSLAGSVLTIAALVLSHNLLGVVGVVLLLAAFVWQVTVEGRGDGVGRGGLAFGLAAALSAFFWLPLLLELGAVQLTVVGAGHFDFRNHFVPLAELLAPPRIVDLGAVAPRYRLNLGPAQWLLALTGGGALLRRFPRWRALSFFALVAVGTVFAITDTSRPLWEAIPWMAYLQFPWRLLGPAALLLAVTGAGGLSALTAERARPVLLAGTLAVTLLLALPLTFVHPWAAEFGDTSPAGIVAFELEGKVVGTTSTGDFLPRTVEIFLRPQESLVASYRTGLVDKVNRATLPDGTTVRVVEHGPTHDRFQVSGGRNFILRLYTLVFPGWRAYVDGVEVPIERGRPEGFITLRVPAGEHQVLVRFEDTPPRRAGWWIAAGGLVVLALGLVLLRPASPVPSSPLLSPAAARWLGGALLLVFLLKFGVVDPLGWLRYTSPVGEAWAARHPQHALLEDQAELLGFDLSQTEVRAGRSLQVVLYWRALQPLQVNYQSFLHLLDASGGEVWGQADTLNPGGLPTTRWPLDRYVWDVRRLEVREDTPPGEYRLVVGWYTMGDGRRLTVVGPDGTPLGDAVVLDVPVVVLPAR
jgi:hypothetical protein